jgi:sterol 3beta-glucosyltransferase
MVVQVPFAKMWSKYLVPKPKDWESHIDVVGFFLDKSTLPSLGTESGDQINPWNHRPLDRKLPDTVKNFLLTGPPPIFVGFGSMVVENPLSLIQVSEESKEREGLRAESSH